MSDVETGPPKQPLSERERALLSQPAPAGTSEQVSLEQRVIEHFVVTGQVWMGGSWRGLQADHVRFVDCTLHGVELSGATLHDVSFERCTLQACRFGDAQLRQCRFVGGSVHGSRTRGARLQGCMLDGVAVEGVLFEATRIEGLQQQGGRLAATGFSECQIEGWQLIDVDLTDVKLTLCEGAVASLRECRVDGLALLGGSWIELALQGGSLARLSLYDVQARALRITGSTSVFGVQINESRLDSCVVSHCPEVLDLYVCASQISRLELGHGRFAGWVTECQLGAGSRVDDATLVGFFWDETRSSGLSFRGVTFKEAICARSAHFHGMRLERVSYEPGCALLLAGASFEQSDRFQGGAR